MEQEYSGIQKSNSATAKPSDLGKDISDPSVQLKAPSLQENSFYPP